MYSVSVTLFNIKKNFNIFDEPDTSLDLEVQATCQRIMKQYNQEPFSSGLKAINALADCYQLYRCNKLYCPDNEDFLAIIRDWEQELSPMMQFTNCAKKFKT